MQVALSVTDELLAHRWGAAFTNMMRSRFPLNFPIGTCHKPACQKQSHKSRQFETAGVATKAELQEFWVVIIWWKFCCGNPQ